jgi:hypothetical protein
VVLLNDTMSQVSVFGDIDLTTEHEQPITLGPLCTLDCTSALVLPKLPSCLRHQFLLHIVFETTLNLSENVVLIALDSYAWKRMDLKQLWG